MSRIGIFGGTFNPIHSGHINSLVEVQKKMDLDQITVVPAYQSPGRELIESPTPEERLEMVRLGLEDQYDFVQVDDREIQRSGESFTIETLMSLKKEFGDNDEYFLIIGLDQFANFDAWKDFNEITSQANLIVTSRPGYTFPLGKKDFPEGLQGEISEFDGYQTLLKSNKWIHFVRLNDIDISSTEVRKRLRIGQSTDRFLSLNVERYIQDHNLYDIASPKVEDYQSFTKAIAKTLEEKSALNTVAFDFTRVQDSIVDYSIVCSATNKRQSSALAKHILSFVKENYGVNPMGTDGMEEGRWIVLDFGALIIHIFYDFVRQEYLLEQLWKNAEKLDLKS